MKAHEFKFETYLCELGELPPVPGQQYMDWGCAGCRAAWVAAVVNGINPKDAPGHYKKGREVADRIGDPHFSRAVAMLGLRVSA